MAFQVKSDKELKALLKPSRKAKVNETIPDGLELIDRLTKRIEKLEGIVRGYQNIVLKYADEVEKLKGSNDTVGFSKNHSIQKSVVTKK